MQISSDGSRSARQGCEPKTREIVGAALAALPSGCGTEDPEPVWPTWSDPDRGFAISFPDSWRRATERLSRITDPRELVSVGTSELNWRQTNCEAFAGSAGVSMGPDAPPKATDQAWAILDTLRLDPSYRPDWRAGG
jgi:hypothetical protein